MASKMASPVNQSVSGIEALRNPNSTRNLSTNLRNLNKIKMPGFGQPYAQYQRPPNLAPIMPSQLRNKEPSPLAHYQRNQERILNTYVNPLQQSFQTS